MGGRRFGLESPRARRAIRAENQSLAGKGVDLVQILSAFGRWLLIIAVIFQYVNLDILGRFVIMVGADAY